MNEKQACGWEKPGFKLGAQTHVVIFGHDCKKKKKRQDESHMNEEGRKENAFKGERQGKKRGKRFQLHYILVDGYCSISVLCCKVTGRLSISPQAPVVLQ